MKKVFTLLLACVLVSFAAKADQYAVFDMQVALKLKAYFEKGKPKEVVSFCDCCDNEKPILLNVVRIGVVESKTIKGMYELGVVSIKDGKQSFETYDLAYLFLKDGENAKTLAETIGLTVGACPGHKPTKWWF